MRSLILLLIAISSGLIISQNRPNMRKHEFGKRFEDLEKIKLLEILEMDEETAIKFFSRRKESKDRVKQIINEGEILIENMEQSLGSLENEDDYELLIQRSLDIERRLLEEKSNYYKSIDDILSKEQIVKLIIFDRKFKRDIRDLLIERGRKKFRRGIEN